MADIFTGGEPLSYKPSDRELEQAGITREQWNNNEEVLVPDGLGPIYPQKAREVVEACDHFEDQYSYSLAKAIVDKINS